ncbi:hypothetical protein [Streptomyces sp. NPDC017529]|uniref:hypothetical protein n=1 Tax=Streptomyces sp. NPDC017529 TaxID=3365000 RepID=UPI003798CC1F
MTDANRRRTRVTDDPDTDKMGLSWEMAREHARRQLGCSRGEAVALVERLAVRRGLEPYQVVQADADELRWLDATPLPDWREVEARVYGDRTRAPGS